MTEASIPEPVLQKWFETVTLNRKLADRIDNLSALKARADQLQRSGRATEKTSREGIANALRVCSVLFDADHLSANMSVSAPGCAQMRPDIVLTSDSGHYVLVELKTNSVPERQGVQELLAYYASIKMQAPYVNDFMFIIVAYHWDDLLVHAVRALIMDGKSVLPLEVVDRPSSGEPDFSLSIHLDLFEFNFVQFFDPWQAMVPAEIGVYRPTFSRAPVDAYLREIARHAVQDCVRLNQTGFAVFWTKWEGGPPVELACSTLVTVNQHWRQGDHLPGDYPRYSLDKQRGFHGLHEKVAKRRRTKVLRAQPEPDFLAEAYANEEVSDVYKQSALSYELLARHRSRAREALLHRQVQDLHEFDICGSYPSLDMFMTQFEEVGMSILGFAAFGEMDDFMKTTRWPLLRNHENLASLIGAFYEFKMSQRGAPADRTSHERLAQFEFPARLTGRF